MAFIGRDILKVQGHLRSNQLIGFPTETVYGLAGNALSEEAILKIYEVKNRPKFDPLISHVDRIGKIEALVLDFPEKARQLAEKFWPGPMTLLLPRNEKIPDLLTSGLSRAAFRIPNHPDALAILKELDFPLAAPSANPFGFVSPTSAQHVQDQLGDKIDYIFDGGECSVGIESTVIGFEGGEVIVHRLGGLSIEEIEKEVGEVRLALNKSSNPDAPGQLKKHYSPGKPVIIGDIGSLIEEHRERKVGVISFEKDFGINKQIVLSPEGDLSQAAKGIFTALRTMKNSDVELIISQKFPDMGVGRAINDRLQRASVQ